MATIPNVGTRRRGLSIPFLGLGQRSIPLISEHPNTPFAEAFRLLAVNVIALTGPRDRNDLAVISAFPGDGRSTVAVNLAIALAESEQVVLYDRDEVSARSLSDIPELGSRVLEPGSSGAPRFSTRSQHGGRLAIATPAPTNGKTASLNGDLPDMPGVDSYSIFDLPAASTSSQAFTLALKAGAALYVIRDRPQDMEVHRRIRENLSRVGVDVIGLVVNEY